MPWMTVDVTPRKDTQARARAVPIPLRKRKPAVDGLDDPLCAYSALARVFERRCSEVPACHGACAWCKRGEGVLRPAGRPPAECARANAPLFTRADGQAYETADGSALGKRMATAAGIEEGSTGGKLWRIGGATDLWDVLGADAARAHIKERGRWKTDIWEIYRRALLGEQLNAAAGMAEATDEDLEAMCPGWAQPAGM